MLKNHQYRKESKTNIKMMINLEKALIKMISKKKYNKTKIQKIIKTANRLKAK